jgi:very-short-patch-repair endonuclease
MANLGPSDSSIHTFTTDQQRWKNLKGFARENRRQPTLAEAQLWQALRTNQLGPRFRRQHAIDDYLVDFVCLPAWLVVEVDGEIHHLPEQAEYDGGRTHALQERGFLVVRYSNEAVVDRLPEVLADIERHLKLLMG